MAGGRPVNQNLTFKSFGGRVSTKNPTQKNASICYEKLELVVVNKVLRSYNTLFHYYNTLGGRGEGCASDRELDVR